MFTRLTVLSAALLLFACGDDGTAQKGSEGGECRISLQPCDDGLVCSLGECREPTSASQTTRLLLEVPIIQAELEADGKAATPIRFKVRNADGGEPYEGDIWMWVEPPGAGVLQDRMVELDDEGQGLTSFVACNGKYRDCPAFATIRFAADDFPDEWIGSRTIRLIGGNSYDRPPAADPDDGMTGSGETDGPPPNAPFPLDGDGNPACDGIAENEGRIAAEFSGEDAYLTVPAAIFDPPPDGEPIAIAARTDVPPNLPFGMAVGFSDELGGDPLPVGSFDGTNPIVVRFFSRGGGGCTINAVGGEVRAGDMQVTVEQEASDDPYVVNASIRGRQDCFGELDLPYHIRVCMRLKPEISEDALPPGT